MEQGEWERLSPDEKKRQLFLRQSSISFVTSPAMVTVGSSANRMICPIRFGLIMAKGVTVSEICQQKRIGPSAEIVFAFKMHVLRFCMKKKKFPRSFSCAILLCILKILPELFC